MQTKYILHGGIAKETNYKQDFFDEIVSGISKKDITILYIPSGENEEKRQKKTTEKQEQFNTFLPEKSITVIRADTNAETFFDQTHKADVIYCGGGNTKNTIAFLKNIPSPILNQHLTNKVVVGASAGANALSKYYFSAHRQVVEEGLGVLPIKVFCHYTEDKEDKLIELESYKEKLTSFVLPENYFVVIR